MPELPDVTIYVERLAAHLVGHRVERVTLASPFLLRTVSPRPSAAVGRTVVGTHRIGKRIVIELEDELFFVVHLMIAGRLRWKRPDARPPRRDGLAALGFAHGTLVLTEASKKKRASLHVFDDPDDLATLDPGGIEVLECDEGTFRHVLRSERHTLKRSLTDPRLFSGIGNAYSDEILHRARLSPVQRTDHLTEAEEATLYEATRTVLREWIERLRADVGDGFPDKVTAFRPEMAVHGRFRLPCPDCGDPVQRIVYAEREVNYCATCQTGGRLLKDRALSRLLKQDWPRTLTELEEKRSR